MAAGTAWVAAGRRRAGWVLAGPVLAATAAVLYVVTPSGFATVVIAVLAGAGAGLAVPRPWRPAAWRALGAGLGAASVVVIGRAVDTRWGVTVAVLATVIAAAVALVGVRSRAPAPRARAGWFVPVAFLVVAAALLGWTGANDPQLSWFGAVASRGPRDDRVAITFDDGPNDPSTLPVARHPRQHGVKGTFFEVGKALDARPDITRALTTTASSSATTRTTMTIGVGSILVTRSSTAPRRPSNGPSASVPRSSDRHTVSARRSCCTGPEPRACTR